MNSIQATPQTQRPLAVAAGLHRAMAAATGDQVSGGSPRPRPRPPEISTCCGLSRPRRRRRPPGVKFVVVLYKAAHHRASRHGCQGLAPPLVRAARRLRASPLSHATPRTKVARSATAVYNRLVSARGPALGWERRTNASSRAAPDATSDQRQSIEDHGADVSTAGRRMPRSSSGHETRRSKPERRCTARCLARPPSAPSASSVLRRG